MDTDRILLLLINWSSTIVHRICQMDADPNVFFGSCLSIEQSNSNMGDVGTTSPTNHFD
jgi:hypothetical protein